LQFLDTTSTEIPESVITLAVYKTYCWDSAATDVGESKKPTLVCFSFADSTAYTKVHGFHFMLAMLNFPSVSLNEILKLSWLVNSVLIINKILFHCNMNSIL